MTEISDITPPHEPVALARDMVESAPGCTAGLYVLVHREGKIEYDMSGHQRMEILWALQKMIHVLMDEPIDWDTPG